MPGLKLQDCPGTVVVYKCKLLTKPRVKRNIGMRLARSIVGSDSAEMIQSKVGQGILQRRLAMAQTEDMGLGRESYSKKRVVTSGIWCSVDLQYRPFMTRPPRLFAMQYWYFQPRAPIRCPAPALSLYLQESKIGPSLTCDDGCHRDASMADFRPDLCKAY